MNTLEAILTHPLPFAFGLLLLLAGTWLLHKGGFIVLACLGLTVASLLAQHLVNAGWMANDLAHVVAVYALGLFVVLLVNRIEVVNRSAELLFTVALCFAVGQTMAEWLHWPAWVFWCIAVAGALFSPVVTVVLFSSALLSFSIAAAGPSVTVPLFVACLLIARFQHGRWWRIHWDACLIGDMRPPRGSVGAAHCGNDLPVVFASDTPAVQAKVIADLKKQGIICHEFPGGSAGAQVPLAILRKWKRKRWYGLLKAQPSAVFSGQRSINVPPVLTESTAEAVSLERVAGVLRSFNDSALPSDVATGKGITLAVLDTGVNPVTPALRKALKERVSMVPHEPDVDDRRGHGTPVAACVVAIAPDVRLMSVKVLDETGRGTLFTVLRGLAYVAAHRHEINAINLSLGAPCCGGNVCPLCQALRALEKLGIASCCAIGNSGPRSGSVECPGASSGTIGVGAVDIDLRVATFSSRGPCRNSDVKKPDLANFGVNLQMPDHKGNLIVASGTSFASPLTAGGMAACLEILNKNGTVASLYDLLRSSCVPAANDSRDPNFTGFGIANLKRAIETLRPAINVEQVAWRNLIRFPPLVRTVAAMAVLVVLAAAWLCGLNHVGSLRYELATSGSVNDHSVQGPRIEIEQRGTSALGNSTARSSAPGSTPHDGRLVQFVERPVTMIGRVERHPSRSGELIFDDGSGKAVLDWQGEKSAWPEPGSVVLLRASALRLAKDGPLVLVGMTRFQLLPGHSAPSIVP
jgi:hypothetical protein